VMAWVKQSGKERLHRMLLEMPFVGTTARKFSTAQSARTLATLLGGGIPLVNALEIGVRSMSNRFLAAELDTVRRQVQEGQSFAAALLARGVFPDVAVKMVEVGESTGALPQMLTSVAEFFEEDVQNALAAAMSLIEPIILIIMGVVVAFVLISLYLPIFTLGAGGVH